MKTTKKDLDKANWEALINFKYLGAIKLYREYEKKNNLSPKRLCELGLFYDHLAQKRKSKTVSRKDEQAALSLYKKALSKNPKFRQAHLGIARVYWHRKDPRCIQFFKKAIPYYPKSIKWQAYQNLANGYYSLKKYKHAEEWYLKALKAGAQGHGFFYNLSQLYYDMGNQEKANYFADQSLWRLKRFWKNKKKSEEFDLTKNLITKIKEGSL